MSNQDDKLLQASTSLHGAKLGKETVRLGDDQRMRILSYQLRPRCRRQAAINHVIRVRGKRTGLGVAARRAFLEATTAAAFSSPSPLSTRSIVSGASVFLGIGSHDHQHPCLFFPARAGRNCSSHLGRATIVRSTIHLLT